MMKSPLGMKSGVSTGRVDLISSTTVDFIGIADFILA
jgi:hypothetical protein